MAVLLSDEVKYMATGIIYDSDGNTCTVINLSSDGVSVNVEYVLNGSITSNLLLPLDDFTIKDTVV